MISRFAQPVPRKIMDDPELRSYFSEQQKVIEALSRTQAPVADATDSTDVVTQFNSLLDRLRDYGVIATD